MKRRLTRSARGFKRCLLSILSFLVVVSLDSGFVLASQASIPGFLPVPGQSIGGQSSQVVQPLLNFFGFRSAKQPALPPLQIKISRPLQSASLSTLDYEDRPEGIPIDTIILHHTAMSSRRWSVWQVADSWQNSPAEVSGHFVVGTRGEVLLAVPVSKTAFHIIKQTTYADPETGESINWINFRSIGLEFHYDPRIERPTKAQIVAGGQLLGALFNQYPDLEVRRIFGHGIQAFSNLPVGKVLTEPTNLFMQPNRKIHSNFLLLLSTAASVSPEVADAVQQAGGVERLAEQLRQQTIVNRQRNLRIDASWKQKSGMPISPIDPEAAIAEAKSISESAKNKIGQPTNPVDQ